MAPTPDSLHRRTAHRDAALQRLRAVTTASIAGAAALAALFAGLAARSFHGHSATPAAVTKAPATASASQPPPLVSAGVGAGAPAAPVAAPTPTQEPPVAVSGGS